MRTILYVDDNTELLRRFAGDFHNSGYRVLTADSGEMALGILASNPVDLVLSDWTMPEMDGVRLLQHVRLLYPEIYRGAVCEPGREEEVYPWIQKNVVKFLITKPWDSQMLKRRVSQLFETREALEKKDLKTLLANLDELPTIEESYLRIVRLIEDDANISRISAEIGRDQSVATKILHTINSSYYGIRTGSLRKAITFIGLKNTSSLVLSTALIDSMKVGESSGTLSKLWDHAYLTNRILLFLYERHLDKPLPEPWLPAGLLHNVGTVFLLKYYLEPYLALLEQARREESPVLPMERLTFGVTHAETGGSLLQMWDFPLPVVESALYHNDPLDPNIIHTELVWAVHIASRYAYRLTGMESYEYFDGDTFDYLGISRSGFESSLRHHEDRLTGGN